MAPSLVYFLKKYACYTPRVIGDVLALIPYSYRLGFAHAYREASVTRLWFEEEATAEEQRNYVFQRVRNMVCYAIRNVPFYRSFYDESGFSPDLLQSFDDLQKIPIVTKDILRSYSLEERSCKRRGRTLTYTGGSTGEPFKFYSDSLQIGNEWAHIHHIWSRLGYHQADLMLSIALSEKMPPVYYDALRHSLVLNIHHPRKVIVKEFCAIPVHKRRVRFFRGYPSAIAEFLLYCADSDPSLLCELKETIKGCFLASEFPLPVFRNLIEKTLGQSTVSWYGHSERAILAWEKNQPFRYETMQSYGFCETVDSQDGSISLVGTSYWNYASPFIRYRVNDGVRVIKQSDGLIREFAIFEGRQGDYLVDRSGQKFSITHLNLSCRESTWEIVHCVQVEQRRPGTAIFWVTPRRSVTLDEVKAAFGFERLNIDCEFRIVDHPFKTNQGKVLLKVSTDKVV